MMITTIVLLMLTALTLMVATTAYVMMDMREMVSTVQVSKLTFVPYTYLSRHIHVHRATSTLH